MDYDCQRCGACCVNPFGDDGYVNLTEGEAGGLRRTRLPVINGYHGQPLLGTVPHHGPGGLTICAAFAGRVGGSCGCSIYEGRPQNCRRFEPGSRLCLEARRACRLPDAGKGAGDRPC
jgi:Fe-S-cluster containining protein